MSPNKKYTVLLSVASIEVNLPPANAALGAGPWAGLLTSCILQLPGFAIDRKLMQVIQQTFTITAAENIQPIVLAATGVASPWCEQFSSWFDFDPLCIIFKIDCCGSRIFVGQNFGVLALVFVVLIDLVVFDIRKLVICEIFLAEFEVSFQAVAF